MFKTNFKVSVLNYRRFARIFFQILAANDSEVVVKVWQMENHAQKYLSAKELIDRTKGVFADVLPPDVKLYVRPVVFNRIELENFNSKLVAKKMDEFGLQTKDLVKLLDIDKSSLSLMLNGKREMSKQGKAMLYYFFKFQENVIPRKEYA